MRIKTCSKPQGSAMGRLTGTTAVTILRADGSSSEEALSPLKPKVETHSADGHVEMPQKLPAVGRCIYCGGTQNLGREHIVPFALSGTSVLPAASCPDCAAITGKFEQEVLRGPMWAVRSLRKLRSRTQHADAPATERIEIVRKGVATTVDLPIDHCPLILHFPTFGPPRSLTGSVGTGIDITGVHSILFGPHPETVLRELGGEKISFGSGDYQYVAFAKMLAKIAYAMAVANGDVRYLEGPASVLSAILGERDDIGQWVGTTAGPTRNYPGLLHRISLVRNRDMGLLLAEVQLFADSETPAYIVVLGRLRPEL